MTHASARPRAGRRTVAVEVLAAVLLSLAAVATAWSGYQVNRWNGEQVKAGGRTNALRIEAARAQGLAEAETQVDVATFIAWMDAYATGDARLQDLYESRFRADFKPAFDAWLATAPFDDPTAPLTPFRMREYDLESAQKAKHLDRAAEASAQSVQQNLQRSANYMLAVVLFAVTLFFAGVSARLTSPRVRGALLTIGALVFVGTLLWLTTFPVSIAV